MRLPSGFGRFLIVFCADMTKQPDKIGLFLVQVTGLEPA
jgi:hypothetical protein